MGSRAVTIRDVAKAAGVAPATVSYGLNGGGRLSAETRERVRATAERLGYKPHRAARDLRTGRTQTLGLMLPAASDGREHPISRIDFYLDLALAVADTAFKHDYRLLLLPAVTAGDARVGVDGMVICNPAVGDGRIAAFDDAGIPVVTIDRDLGRPERQAWVASDTARSTREILDHLADQGAQKIVLLNGSADWSWPAETGLAYRAWCADHGRPAHIVSLPLPPRERATARAVSALLGQDSPPDAIVGLPIAFASTVMRVADELGVRVPDDLLVASCVDGREAIGSRPAITAVDIAPGRQAAAAVELLLTMSDGQEPSGPVIVPSSLRLRASTMRSPPLPL